MPTSTPVSPPDESGGASSNPATMEPIPDISADRRLM